MFRIVTEQEQTHIHYEDKRKDNYASFILEEGGRMSRLILDGKKIIANPDYTSYQEHYGGAILFPFVNRVKDGRYQYQGKDYQLAINEKALNNAHHGLVYNKEFKLRSISTDEDRGELKLSYVVGKRDQGFPFDYEIELCYQITEMAFSLMVRIHQKDKKSFPYSIGWHPYFVIEENEVAELFMDVVQQAAIDQQGIAHQMNAYKVPKPFEINHRNFDDCYALASNTFYLKTQAYQLKIESSFQEPYLQIYTPPVGNLLALEPATGLSNSFNHQIGLKALKPKQEVEYSWKISLDI